MKVPAKIAHLPLVEVGAFFDRDSASEAESESAQRTSVNDDETLAFDAIYQAWFEHTCRWLRAHGIPASDREDVAQDVFLVVQKKLPSFDGRYLAAWLYKITKQTASDHRRRAWFKNMFRKRSDFVWDGLTSDKDDPEARALSRDALRTVNAVLGKMETTRRTAFVLFEIEGYSGEEIASFENVPVATIWTRLHYARKEFQTLLAETEEGS